MEDTRLEIRLQEFSKEEQERCEKLGIKFPLYAKCYEDALKAILSNINYNQNSKNDRKDSDNFFIGMEGDYAAPLEKSNIIAFIGDRGSGKTTAVNEFSRILYEYYDKHKKWNLMSVDGEGERNRFHVMAPIDASVLETKEDLLEVILASMYQAFEKKIEYHKKSIGRSDLIQNIVHDFDSAYQDYINVGRRGEQFGLGETALAKLKYISNSLKTKNAIKSLIDNFLDLLDERNGKPENSYLVVVIDDLDMSPENGHEMLEQLHKYLAYERVIILIAIKYEQMKMICDQHFVDCLTPEYGGAHERVYNKFYKRARMLSSDYLLKVLPMPNRIYMPKNNLKENGIIIDQQKKLSVKEFILKKIAVKMNIYYDANGLKRHFCLPDTVRELVSYNEFLESLYSIEEIGRLSDTENERWIGLYDQNHERFNNNIEYRMAVRILDDEQLDIYRLIMDRNIERRAKYAISFLESWMEEKKKKEQKGKTKVNSGTIMLKDKVDERGYCYSDLLEIIYKLGREDYDDKVLVHCILASFTSEMVREYYSYKHNDRKDARQRAENRLKCFLGNTFGGKWFVEWMPKVEEPKLEKKEMEIGYIPNANMSKIQVDIGIPEEDNAAWMKKVLLDIVPQMERLTLMLSDFKNLAGEKVEPEWEFEFGCGESGGRILTIRSSAHTAIYDIFGFIGKELKHGEKDSDIRNLNKGLAKNMRECLKKELIKLKYSGKKIGEVLNGFEKEVSEKSIWVGVEDEKRNIEFPYYNFDLSYNIMKRVRSKLRENTQLRKMGIYEYFCTVYEYVANELKKEEMYYQGLLENDMSFNFLSEFINAPYMKVFEVKVKEKREGTDVMEIKNQQMEKEKNKFNKFLYGILYNINENTFQPPTGGMDTVE